MNDSQLLDYTVISKEKYGVNGDKIENTVQKSCKGWTAIGAYDQFVFDIRLRHRSNVHFAEVRPIYAHSIKIALLAEKDKEIDASQKILSNQDAQIYKFDKSIKDNLVVIKIRVTLGGNLDDHKRQLGLKYLILKGFKREDKKGDKSRGDDEEYLIKPVRKEKQFFDSAKFSPHALPMATKSAKKTQIFSQRKKTKEKPPSEDEQFMKAIKASQQEMRGYRQVKVERQNPQQMRDYQDEKARQYSTIDFQKVKKVFQYVNAGWLQAQKKAEQHKNIKVADRLSNRINVRLMHGKTVCFDILGNKRAKLQKIARQMGANVLIQPKDNCLLISNKADSEIVRKARKLKGVKILNQQYLEHCQTCTALLEERDYLVKF